MIVITNILIDVATVGVVSKKNGFFANKVRLTQGVRRKTSRKMSDCEERQKKFSIGLVLNSEVVDSDDLCAVKLREGKLGADISSACESLEEQIGYEIKCATQIRKIS